MLGVLPREILPRGLAGRDRSRHGAPHGGLLVSPVLRENERDHIYIYYVAYARVLKTEMVRSVRAIGF